MDFEDMRTGEETEVSKLVWGVFAEFEAPEYSEKGIEELKEFILPANIKARCDAGRFFFVCAKDDGKIVGVISVRDHNHISLLFVKKEYHRRGIGRRLFEIALARCCAIDDSLRAITVNSSPYAVAIYEKLGFERTDCKQEKYGIVFIPMMYRVKQSKK